MQGIKELAQEHGKENLIFLVPRKSFGASQDEAVLVPCRIEERYNRTVKDNYKLILKPIPNSGFEHFNEDDVYVSDLQSLIREGIYHVFVKPKLGWPLAKYESATEGAA